MRYEKGHKEITRARIVSEASRRFREEGIDAVGVANLMSGIGLTQGGFYNHFESKDELAREAISSALEGTIARLGEENRLAALAEVYLSPRHRDNPGRGCAAAALAPEVARGSAQLRSAFTGELQGMLASIRTCLPAALSARQKRSTAMAIFGSMVGTLALARAVDDPALSDEFLAAGRRAVLAMVPATSVS
jgi:TetR/AcrR family transcriptional repressor of nem operon